MGPPIFIGGNSNLWALYQMFDHLLQWGHRFSSVEIPKQAQYLKDLLIASMGPPIFIGGNKLTEPFT